MTKDNMKNESSSLIHIDNIINAVGNECKSEEKQPSYIYNSWDRCINKYNISPEQSFSPYIIDNSSLLDHQEAFEDKYSLIQNYFDNLYNIIGDNGYTLLLTDKDGITLHCRHEEENKKVLQKTGIYTGTDWSESVAGTNGIGTCLVEQKPIIVDKGDHFYPIMTGMTCIVSPIYDGYGELVASLNASILRPAALGQNSLVSKLIQQYSKHFEMIYFVEKFQINWLFKFSKFNNISDNLTTGILAINEDGFIISGNRNAYSYLCGNQDRKINGKNINEIFDISFSELVNGYLRKTDRLAALNKLDSGEVFFYGLLSPRVTKKTGDLKKYKAKDSLKDIRKNQHPDLESLKGQDANILMLSQKLEQVIDTDLHILLIGETGTGKEAWARAIHNKSMRKDKPFVAINCAAIPESLIESELFGYNTGTFTGALKQGMKGKILQANGGTLFLDEIGDMPLLLQTRLLRVLSELEVMPLGESNPIPLDIQLISATNKNISIMIEENTFRSDLYFRLNGMVLNLPALRYRTDKKALILKIYEEYSHTENIDISSEVMDLLINYHWPGNIRELINVIKYSTTLCKNGIVEIEHLPANLINQPCSNADSRIEYSEYDLLINSLKSNKWNITKVSKDLNICRATVYRKMKKHGIVSPNDQ